MNGGSFLRSFVIYLVENIQEKKRPSKLELVAAVHRRSGAARRHCLFHLLPQEPKDERQRGNYRHTTRRRDVGARRYTKRAPSHSLAVGICAGRSHTRDGEEAACRDVPSGAG